MQKAGYLINTEAGPVGERGQFFDYIFADNGVYSTAIAQVQGQ